VDALPPSRRLSEARPSWSNEVANLGPGTRVVLAGDGAGGSPFRGVWGALDDRCPAGEETVERRRERLLRGATGARGRVWRGGAAAV